jgi:hypothetical protein
VKVYEPSPNQAEKIDRYLVEGRCNILVPGAGLTARFRGESGRWWTASLFHDGAGECECPAWSYGKPCVHTLCLARVAEDPR